jgi:mutator protein MutT
MADTVPHFHIALAIIWRDGRVLVTRRRANADHLPDVWEFPGGKCEDGETPHDAAIREAREELGIEVEVAGEHAPIHHEYSQRRVTLHPFDCVITSGEPQPLHSAGLRWLAPHELHEDDFPAANAQLIAQLRGGSSQAHSGF